MRFLNFFFNIKYLPILILYIGIVYIFSAEELVSDRLRYWSFSSNLLDGFYFDDQHTLWNGPGYPIYIAFLRFFSFGWKAIVFTNSLLLYFSVMIFNKIMVNNNIPNAFYLTYLFALWEPVLLYQYLPHLMTEVFSIFLISCFTYYMLETKTLKRNLLLGIIFCFIILTKVIFAYVALSMFIISLFFKKLRDQRFYYIPGYAILFCIPYLIYTYNLTGKIFYFSNAGGSSLYWMTSTKSVLRGDWNGGNGYTQHSPNLASKQYNEFLKNNTWPFFEKIDDLGWVEQDQELKRVSIENIKKHKLKFIQNWINNLGRLLYGYPFSFHTPNWQHILVTIKQSFFIVFFVLALYLSIINYTRISPEYIFLIAFLLIYLSGVSLLSAYPRFLFITNIVSWVIMANGFKNYIKIKLISR